MSNKLDVKLKNLRRKPRAEAAGIALDTPAKKQRIETNHPTTAGGMKGQPSMDETAFQRHLNELGKEWSKTKRTSRPSGA